MGFFVLNCSSLHLFQAAGGEWLGLQDSSRLGQSSSRYWMMHFQFVPLNHSLRLENTRMQV